MHTNVLAPVRRLDPSALADRLYVLLRSIPPRWIVLDPRRLAAELAVSEQQVAEAVDQLDAVGLIERAAFGPLVRVAREAA